MDQKNSFCLDRQEIMPLLNNLQAQKDLYDKALDLAQRQRRSLINNKLDENERVNSELDSMCNKLAKAENDRQQEIRNIVNIIKAKTTGKGWKTISIDSCSSLYPFIDEDCRIELETTCGELKQRVAKMRELNELNAVLVQTSRNIIHATINIITGLAGSKKQVKSETYGSKGKRNPYQKQNVNLFIKEA